MKKNMQKRRRRTKWVWFRGTGSLDNVSVTTPQAIVILDPTTFIFNPNLEGQTVTVRRVIIDTVGFSFSDISSSVAYRFGVCLIDQNAPNPDPEILTADSSRTDWLDLWNSPVADESATQNLLWDQHATPAVSLASAGSTSFCHRNIKVSRRIQSRQELLWVMKAVPFRALTANHVAVCSVTVSILCKLSGPV